MKKALEWKIAEFGVLPRGNALGTNGGIIAWDESTGEVRWSRSTPAEALL